MRSLAAAVSAIKTGHHIWNTPIPYLFGGIALTLFLILTSLILLLCSYRKRSDQEHQIHTPPKTAADDLKPRIVVIMAGNHTPTFLATAAPSDSSRFPPSTEQF